MNLSDLKTENLSREVINKILFEDIVDDGKKCDCILVPASKTGNKYRTPAAVQQYFQGRSSKILFSGGGTDFLESVPMKEMAIELGVPEEDIIIEKKSTNTKENVIESLVVMDSVIGLQNIKRILICTAFYHMRRCYLTLKKHAPSWIEYSYCPVLDKTTRPDNWWNHESGRSRVYKEVEGLIKYAKQGDIEDFVIKK